MGEELGWRGFVQPRLQERWSGLSASLILGALWSLWHLARLWTQGAPPDGWGMLAQAIGLLLVAAEPDLLARQLTRVEHRDTAPRLVSGLPEGVSYKTRTIAHRHDPFPSG
jgi:hypothetical protein